MAKHIRYWMQEANECGVKEHPQEVMEKLGVTYQVATPQSVGDQWWFWNCENIPKKLPKYLEIAKLDPMKMIGSGLSRETAESILNYTKKMKNQFSFQEIDGNVIIECGGYHFTYCNVTIPEMLDDWSWRDFIGCSSDEDCGVVLDISEKYVDRIFIALSQFELLKTAESILAEMKISLKITHDDVLRLDDDIYIFDPRQETGISLGRMGDGWVCLYENWFKEEL